VKPIGGIVIAGGLILAALALAKKAKGGLSSRYGGISEFIAASHFQAANRTAIGLIVIHTTEAPKTDHTAHDVATNWTALPTTQVSAHYIVDSDHVVQTVQEKDIAFHARGGNVNAISIGVEHAGSAGQSAAQWDDAFNSAMLARSASLVASLCERYAIPVVWLAPADVRAGKRGITGHAEVTQAFAVPNGHGDPGAAFPRARYIALVKGSAS